MNNFPTEIPKNPANKNIYYVGYLKKGKKAMF